MHHKEIAHAIKSKVLQKNPQSLKLWGKIQSYTYVHRFIIFSLQLS